jgi:uncharacterized protein (TIGR00369 family)
MASKPRSNNDPLIQASGIAWSNPVDDLEQRISASFRAQGLLTLLGAELTHVAEGEVHIALAPRPELCQKNGHVHAGALASVLGSACAYAGMTVAPPGLDVLTVEFKVNFLRPAAPADRYVAIGKVTKVAEKLTMCRGEIIGEKGSQREAIAVMQATIINVPGNA